MQEVFRCQVLSGSVSWMWKSVLSGVSKIYEQKPLQLWILTTVFVLLQILCWGRFSKTAASGSEGQSHKSHVQKRWVEHNAQECKVQELGLVSKLPWKRILRGGKVQFIDQIQVTEECVNTEGQLPTKCICPLRLCGQVTFFWDSAKRVYVFERIW